MCVCAWECLWVSGAESAVCVCRCVLTGVCVCLCVSEEARGDVAAVSCFSPSLPEKSIPDAAELPSPPFSFTLLQFISPSHHPHCSSSSLFFIWKKQPWEWNKNNTSYRTFYPIPQVVFSHWFEKQLHLRKLVYSNQVYWTRHQSYPGFSKTRFRPNTTNPWGRNPREGFEMFSWALTVFANSGMTYTVQCTKGWANVTVQGALKNKGGHASINF